MLVLSRKTSEKIIITTPGGEQITLLVLKVERNKVSLAFDASAEVVIDREEIYNDKQTKSN